MFANAFGLLVTWLDMGPYEKEKLSFAASTHAQYLLITRSQAYSRLWDETQSGAWCLSRKI